MSLQLLPLPTNIAAGPKARGLGWSVIRTPQFSTIINESASGRRIRLPLWKNPLWTFQFTYGYMWDDPANIGSGNTYTDFQTLVGFFLQMQGQGQDFAYQPADSVVTGQVLGSLDANNNTELVHTIGGFSESVVELNGGTPAIYANGVLQTAGTNYNMLGPATTAPYDGWVVNWLVIPTPPLTANYTYFYRCQFDEGVTGGNSSGGDYLDFENFMFNLFQLKKMTIRQVRL
jgi:hypothetical protein